MTDSALALSRSLPPECLQRPDAMAYREGAAFGRPTLRSSGPVARDARTRPLSDALHGYENDAGGA